jgi:hypothetical protein
MLIRSGALDVIVIDSVAALVPRAEIEGEMGDSHVGLQARLMSQALRKITGALSNSGTTLIFINQLREKIGVMFGSPETTTGGKALKFYASVRIDVRRIETLKDGTDAVGNRTRAKVVKNKVAPAVQAGRVRHHLRAGHQPGGLAVDVGVEQAIVRKSGAGTPTRATSSARARRTRGASCATTPTWPTRSRRRSRRSWASGRASTRTRRSRHRSTSDPCPQTRRAPGFRPAPGSRSGLWSYDGAGSPLTASPRPTPLPGARTPGPAATGAGDDPVVRGRRRSGGSAGAADDDVVRPVRRRAVGSSHPVDAEPADPPEAPRSRRGADGVRRPFGARPADEDERRRCGVTPRVWGVRPGPGRPTRTARCGAGPRGRSVRSVRGFRAVGRPRAGGRRSGAGERRGRPSDGAAERPGDASAGADGRSAAGGRRGGRRRGSAEGADGRPVAPGHPEDDTGDPEATRGPSACGC